MLYQKVREERSLHNTGSRCIPLLDRDCLACLAEEVDGVKAAVEVEAGSIATLLTDGSSMLNGDSRNCSPATERVKVLNTIEVIRPSP